MRARDLGLACGDLPTGPRNAISDVPGVTVGHCTLSDGDIQTGVTAIIPHQGNIFTDKLVAAADVLNGFGKSVGPFLELSPLVVREPAEVGRRFHAGKALGQREERRRNCSPADGDSQPGPDESESFDAPSGIGV